MTCFIFRLCDKCVKFAYIAVLSYIFSISPALAQKGVITHYNTGTGFFVTPYGELITNEHVIRECREGSITLGGAVDGTAEVIAVNKEYDLALLNASLNAPSVGKLRAAELSLSPGDPVMIMGYPKDTVRTGEYKIATAKVEQLKGPQGEAHWLQFSDSAQQGNSGGPLLDMSGNIIGVVSGKSEFFSVDPSTHRQISTGHADFAVTLPVLKSFLNTNRLRYQPSHTLVARDESTIETEARRFIVSIKCVTGTETVH